MSKLLNLLALGVLVCTLSAQTTITGTITGINNTGWKGVVTIVSSNRCTPSGGGIIALSTAKVDMSASTTGTFQHADGTAVVLMPTDVCTETGTHYDVTYSGVGDRSWTEEWSVTSSSPNAIEDISTTAGSVAQTIGYTKITGCTAKGSMFAASGTSLGCEAVGTNDFVLTADSAQTNGVKWAALGATLDVLTGASAMTTDNYLICTDGTSGLMQLCTGISQLGTANIAQQIIQAGSSQSTNPLMDFLNSSGTRLSVLSAGGGFVVYDSGGTEQRTSVGSGFLLQGSGGTIQWRDATDLAGATTDLCLDRAAAGVLQISDDCSSTEYFRVDGPGAALRVPASSYFNWGATSGTSGYGYRDNAGQLEFKHSGGSWAEVGSAGGAAPVLMALDGSVADERVLAAGVGITVTDGGANSDATVAVDPTYTVTAGGNNTLTGINDLGGAASLEVPNSAAPTVDAAGEVALDTTIANMTSVLRVYGAEELALIPVPIAEIASLTDGDGMFYSAANDEFEIAAQSGGGSATQETYYPICGIASGATGHASWSLTSAIGLATADNICVGVFQNADGEIAYLRTQIPANWDGSTIQMNLIVQTEGNGAAADTAFGAQVSCAGDGDSITPSYTTEDTNVVAHGAINEMSSTLFDGLTLTGCTAGDAIWWKVERHEEHASDTRAASVHVQGATVIMGVQ